MDDHTKEEQEEGNINFNLRNELNSSRVCVYLFLREIKKQYLVQSLVNPTKDLPI